MIEQLRKVPDTNLETPYWFEASQLAKKFDAAKAARNLNRIRIIQKNVKAYLGGGAR